MTSTQPGTVRPRYCDALFVGGEWISPTTSQMFDLVNPATEEVIDQVAECLEADVSRATTAPRAQHSTPRFADSHRQLNAFGYFEEVDHPILGTHRLPTLPFHFSSVSHWVRSNAPVLGEHNDDVLRGLLGLGAAEMSELRARSMVGNTPLGSNPSFSM